MSTDSTLQDELNESITIACQRLFQFVAPHEWQSTVIRSLVLAHRHTNCTNMLVIRPTGSGKYLIYQVLGASMVIQGITLFISPLLALASDQTGNLKQRTSDLPDVTCIHLDGMPEAHVSIIADDISGMRHHALARSSRNAASLSINQIELHSNGGFEGGKE